MTKTLILTTVLLAQSASPPAFEVASVKVNSSGSLRTDARISPSGRVELTNQPLKALIRTAYSLPESQIAGGPDWVDSARFDVVATAGRSVTEPELRQMLQSLLSDRFKLVAHKEPREVAVYALTLARAGAPGKQLRASDADCVGRQLRPPKQGAGPSPTAGCAYDVAGGTIVAHGFPLARLVESLSIMLRRLVIDRTGLTGNFDFEMTWTPEQRAAGDITPFDPNAPVFTALQEQLGLKLEATKVPVDVLVIDRAEKPAED